MQVQSLERPRSHDAPQCGPRALDDGELKLIGVTKSYARDQQIFAEGDPADFVYRVVAGAVRSVRLLSDGRRQIAEFYLPGDVFGVEFGLEHRASAESVGDAVVVVARRSTVTSDANQDARLWRQALRELERSQDHVLTLGRRTAVERVVSFILDIAERRRGADDHVMDLPVSRQDIADYLGLTIETVSRTLTQLQTQGLIEVSGCRRVRLVRPAALADLCE
jgi:CRP/FNR family nitrogen fixation transcriptional regulator